MNDVNKEKMLDLLTAKATGRISEEEARQLKELEEMFSEFKDDHSFELAAAAIGLINLKTDEPLPAHLRNRILDDAEQYLVADAKDISEQKSSETEEYQKTLTFAPKRSIWQSLGWVFAAAACIALAVVIWNKPRVEYVQAPPPQITPTPTPNANEQRQQLLASSNDLVQKSWTDFDPKKPLNVRGDFVWSNSAQKGFARFQNMPVNDKSKETYQIWIFDETQKNPISAGVFDADQTGEIIIPMEAAIRVEKPTMIGITVEKPGGVMVSDLSKVMAVAKIET